MGRIKSASDLEKQVALAKAREAYYKNKTVTKENVNKTVQKRGMDAYVYSSYMLTDSTGASERMLVQASAASVTKFGGATALLLVDPASITTTIGKKPKSFTPAQVHAMSTSGTPAASASPWGTRVIKYSGTTTGTSQAHFVAPISGDLNATFAEVSARAKTVYNTIKGSLGSDDYHRFWFSPEFMNIQEN